MLRVVRLCVVLVFAGVPRLAVAQLSAEDVAVIEREQAKAAAAVEAKYPGKLSAAQVKQLNQEKVAAQRAVLEGRGVNPAEFLKASAKMKEGDRAAAEAKKKALEQADAAANKKTSEGGSSDSEVVIEKGGKNEAAEMDRKLNLKRSNK